MPDIEKVIRGLECHAKGTRGCQQECPYGNENGCQLLLCADALTLLKEQENASKRNPVIVCPHCGKRVKRMGALSFSETINRLSEYRHGDRECFEDDNTIKIDCQTFAYAEYWLHYAYESGHLAEIIRCKDCKYHGNICPDYCVNLEQNTNDDFYCAYGERRTDDA